LGKNDFSKRIKMRIQVACGMIASGKSTYARNAAKAGIICMNDDAIVNMLHGGDYTLYDKKFKILYKSIENHIIAAALTMGRSVFIDRGLNISVNGRYRWIALARSFDVPIDAIVFKNEGPEIHTDRRMNSDSRGHARDYWLDVAKYHDKSWQLPTVDEGFASVQEI
jgi:predicted kinase